MLFCAALLIGLYLCVTVALRRRKITIEPCWMPHGDISVSPFLQKAVPIIWGLPALVGVALLFSPWQHDFGVALLGLLACALTCGLVFGLLRRAEATSDAPATTEPTPPTPVVDEAGSLSLVEAPQAPFGSRTAAPGLHFTSLPVGPDELSHHVPRPLAERILSAVGQARKQAEEMVAANTTLRSQEEQMGHRIAELEKGLHEAEQAGAELGRLNQSLRSRSATEEKPFSQMTLPEMEKARDAREREIRNLDELKRARTLRQAAV